MAFKLPENVQETSTTTGTGTLTLAGAAATKYAFSSQLSNNDTTAYIISDGTDIECGIGTYTNTSGQQLSRDTVVYSTNGGVGGSLVNWAAGTRNVFVGLIGNMLQSLVDPSAGNGMLAQTADRTYARRTITGTAGEIAVAYGDGVSANPTLSLDCTAFAKTILDDTDAATVRATIDAQEHVMTAVGDILYGGTAGAPTRLAIGSEMYTLAVDPSGYPVWTKPGATNLDGVAYVYCDSGDGVNYYSAGVSFRHDNVVRWLLFKPANLDGDLTLYGYNTSGASAKAIYTVNYTSGNMTFGYETVFNASITLGTANMPEPEGSAPLYCARAWGRFNWSAHTWTDKQGNITSMTDNGTGFVQINIATDMPNTTYAVQVASNFSGTPNGSNGTYLSAYGQLVGSFDLYCVFAGAMGEPTNTSFAVFGGTA